MSPPQRMQQELGGGEDRAGEAPQQQLGRAGTPVRAPRRSSLLSQTLALIAFVILIVFAAAAGAGLGAAYAFKQLGQNGHGTMQAPGGKP